MKRFMKMLLLLFTFIIVLFFIKAVFFPVYIYHSGNPFIQEPQVRCICYGTVHTWMNYASDPPDFSICIGFSPRASCEIKANEGWSKEAYQEKF